MGVVSSPFLQLNNVIKTENKNLMFAKLMVNKFKIMQGISVQFVSSVTVRLKNSKDKQLPKETLQFSHTIRYILNTIK